MTTSSCETSVEVSVSAVRPSCVDEDTEKSDSSTLCPYVRQHVASFESQRHRQHRQLCRTDDISKQQSPRSHERPQPPCKTTAAVLKARHLRAASDDLSRSWKSTDQSEIANAARSVVELRMALLNTANQNGRRRDSSDNDVGLRFTENRKEPTPRSSEHSISVTFDSEVDGSSQYRTGKNMPSATIPAISVDSLREVEVDTNEQQTRQVTDGVVNGSTGDDVGYFSLPDRRPAERLKHQSPRIRSRSWHHDSPVAAADDDDDDEVEFESCLTYSSDSAGSLSPGPRISQDRHNQTDVSSSLGNCHPEDEQCQSACEKLHHRINVSSPANVFCDHIVINNCLSSPDAATCNQRSDKLDGDEDWGNSRIEESHSDLTVTPAKLDSEKLSEMMTASFGRCDEVLCRAVGTVGSYRTAVSYLTSLFPETGQIRLCAFDLTHACQLDATSTGVQFLTLEAVREAARRYILQERDKMLNIKEEMDNEENLLKQLDTRVAEVIGCKSDVRQLKKCRQFIDEMERVTRLLILLAARLARLDNASLQLQFCGNSQPNTPKSLSANRYELMEKFADASTLKSDINRRGRAISDLLTSRLSTEEMVDYRRLMVEKTRLRLQRQELEDWLRLAEQQLKELSVDVDAYVQELISHC